MIIDGGRLSTDALFQILGNSRRRFIIRHLYREQRPVDLKEMAARIAAEEEGTSVEDVTNEERQRVYVSLYQTHLPTLTDSGLVSYDDEQKTLLLDRQALEEHCVQPRGDQWLVGYGVVAAVELIVAIAYWSGVFGGSLALSFGLLLVMSLVLTGLVVGQYLAQRRAKMRECLIALVD